MEVSEAAAVEVFVSRGSPKGYVWDADDSLFLRRDCHIVGVMRGGLTKYRQQTGLCSLPMELSGEEVAIALHKGWIMLSQVGPVGEGAPPDLGSDLEGPLAEWTARLKPKTHERIVVPLTLQGLTNLEGASVWRYPETQYERARCAVFADLHNQGLWLTSGTKFGSDFLAYPGDPSMYHAQYTVRVEAWDKPLNITNLVGIGRASHTARKHMLLSSVPEDPTPGAGHWSTLRAQHVCVAPEAGFGREKPPEAAVAHPQAPN